MGAGFWLLGSKSNNKSGNLSNVETPNLGVYGLNTLDITGN